MLPALALFLAAALAAAGPVPTDAGMVSGTREGGVLVYRGIPFAAPPVGNLRWRAPVPVTPWKGVRAATAFGPACYQEPAQSLAGTRLENLSEDCLYLNVWTPAVRPGPLPVMLWIHGGGHAQGAGSLPFYDGAKLAGRGVLVVTINYRLGPFGYLAHPALSRESPHGVSGNYGMLDQIAALEWVRRNIAAFGGDARRVTVFGESAGSVSAMTLMAAPAARALFQRIIAESGVPVAVTRPLREWEREGQRIAAKLGCTDAAWLRGSSAQAVLEAAHPVVVARTGEGTHFQPIVDGWLLPSSPAQALAQGQAHKVDLLIGTNVDEGTVFARALGIDTVEAWRRRVRGVYGARAEEALGLYPVGGGADLTAAVARWWGDVAFTCPARAAARLAAEQGLRTWGYFFTHVPLAPAASRLGAFHGAEILFVFGNVGLRRAATPVEERLSEAMMGAWTRFAATGDPNGPGLPEWPRYDARAGAVMEFGAQIRVRTGVRAEACDLFDQVRKK